MSHEFLLRNLKTISRDNKNKLVSAGLLVRTAVFRADGFIQKYEYALTEQGEILLGIKKAEEKSKYLRFCSACGKGHWRKGKQFCTEECKLEKNKEKKKKELDFETVMKEIRAKKEEQKEKAKEYQRNYQPKYYAENRPRLLDMQSDYRHKRRQERFIFTVMTTKI